MKIDSCTLGMESARSYYTSEITTRRFELTEYAGATTQGGLTEQGSEDASGKEGDLLKGAESGKNALQNWIEHMQSVRSNYHLRSDEETTAENIRQLTIKEIFEQLFEQHRKRWDAFLESWGISCEGSAAPAQQESAEISSPNVQTLYLTETVEHYEHEETSFATTGTVRCADGREISFNVNVTMSREFSEYAKRDLGFSVTQCIDPLVINLDGNVTSVSDQTFYFDLDCDGQKDQISSLGAGSGFLALDKNGDGVIHDGSELFGTASGDGFADLAAYDLDRNGWIDENDEIWDRLKVWTRDENGKDILYSLSQAGVGALCVNKVGTEFALKDEKNDDNAFIRSTGVFLYENGGAGTLQHVDLVKYA
ncbi:MAG: hypothetical protein K5891_12450 [Lachnospiraceae bacterium]|nr:hypothetical protein [Lachnospiraceae bacterium]